MRTRSIKRAFTLIEILIVVVILGILAAIVIPQFSEASEDAAESSVRSTLQTVRAQLELYKFKEGAYPATMAALVSGGYLQQSPVAPTGCTFDFTAIDTGVVSGTCGGATW